MIPQPLKWVGAIVALVIIMVVVAPIAYESLLNMVTFSDEGGLISGTDDPLDDDEDLEGTGTAEAEESDGGRLTEPEGVEGAAEDEEGDEAGDQPPDTYVVQSGDTLFSIAQEVYGDGARWEEIADANEVTDRTGITVGQELVIP